MSIITAPAPIPFGPIGQSVYQRTYSRPLPTGWNETWYDTVRRVVHGNTTLEGAGWCLDGGRLTELMDDFRLLPAGRHLWVTGVPGVPGEARRNCWRAPFTADLGEHFRFTGSMLLLGGGVGANYSQEYLNQAPAITPFDVRITIDSSHPDAVDVMKAAGPLWVARDDALGVQVDDSREGWVDAWGSVFEAATMNGSIELDLTQVRPAGEPIRTFGGTASGPGPLASSILGIVRVLQKAVGRKLSGIEAMHCDHALASAVVAGGARRSARMSIMHWRDPSIFEFLVCKADHMDHWTTNISVEVDAEFFDALRSRDVHAMKVYDKVIEGMIANGEPGFYNVALSSEYEYGDVRATNPCGEVPLMQGESCNIGSVNLDAIGTDDATAEEAFRLMTRFLIRQTLTQMKPGISADIETKNRRIGVGFLGLQGWAAAHGVRYSEIPYSQELRAKLIRFRQICRTEADAYCDELGIARCIKVTAIAPNGSIAQLPGTQPGAHAILMRYGIRNVRYTTGDQHISEALDAGLVVEGCIYAENTWVVSYPMIDPLMERFDPELIEDISQVSVDQQLAVLAFVTDTFCSGADGNAVSFTASFDPKVTTYHELHEAVLRWLPYCKGITVFGTETRPQAPYIPISEEAYYRLTDHGARDTGDTGTEDISACSGGSCPIR